MDSAGWGLLESDEIELMPEVGVDLEAAFARIEVRLDGFVGAYSSH